MEAIYRTCTSDQRIRSLPEHQLKKWLLIHLTKDQNSLCWRGKPGCVFPECTERNIKSDSLNFFPNKGLNSLGHFGRNGHTVNGAGMVSGLSEDFLVGGSINLSVAVEADITAFERFHTRILFGENETDMWKICN